jgi:hypothetical protein
MKRVLAAQTILLLVLIGGCATSPSASGAPRRP